MRIAVVQTNPTFGEIARNIRSALSLMDTVKADVFVLPELFSTGYDFVNAKEVESLSESIDGTTFQTLAQWIRMKSCYVVYGFAEKSVNFYNSAALIGPSGLVGLYRKIHLFNRENVLFTPGDFGFPVFDLPYGRIGIMICFDWIYPESARSLALKGAQLIVHPSNLVLPDCPDAMITRCLENRVFTATADRVGKEKRSGNELRFIGTSEIVAPNGTVLCRLGDEKEEISVVEIDLTLSNRKRINDHNDLLVDRRTRQYFLG